MTSTQKKIQVSDGIWTHNLCDLARRSNHWATGDSMVSMDEMWVFDWNHISQPHSQIMTSRHIWSHNCIMQSR